MHAELPLPGIRYPSNLHLLVYRELMLLHRWCHVNLWWYKMLWQHSLWCLRHLHVLQRAIVSRLSDTKVYSWQRQAGGYRPRRRHVEGLAFHRSFLAQGRFRKTGLLVSKLLLLTPSLLRCL